MYAYGLELNPHIVMVMEDLPEILILALEWLGLTY